eukprot:5596588-Amphidinium_carterae.2
MNDNNEFVPYDDPMQVDAAQYGKGKGKGGKAKGKGKDGKNKKGGSGKKGQQKGNASQGGKSGAGANSTGSAAGSSSTYFEGECGYCGKWGHKRADCRKRLSMAQRNQGSAGSTGGSVSATSTETPAGVQAVSAAPATQAEMAEGWVFAVCETSFPRDCVTGVVSNLSDDYVT